MRRWHGVLVLAVVVALASAASAAPADLLGKNLVVNGNAEASQGLPHAVPLVGWTTTGHFTAVQYGYDDYPSMHAPGPSDRGKQFFSGGTNDPISTAYQSINVSGAGKQIDQGHIRYTFTAWIGGWSSQADYATVTAFFLGAHKQMLRSVTLGPVTNTQRAQITALLKRTASGTLPSGTRSIGIKIVSTRFAGASNDGYVDNVSFVLSSG